jgi:glycosyltransferase involved in cell wall biosynthesis
LALFPSRVIPRKNVEAAIEYAQKLNATLWILGPAEDGYEEVFASILDAAETPIIVGRPRGFDIDDFYAAADLVVVPSTWEGFGNPVLESVTRRKPLAVYPYPVLEEIRSFGFEFFDLEQPEEMSKWLKSPDDLLERNWAIANQHFNIDGLPAELATILEEMGFALDL